MQFKVGDRVKILRKAKTHERGWQNTWVNCMDDNVGKVGRIVLFSGGKHDVQVKTSYSEDWGYPAFVLQKVRKVAVKAKKRK